MTKNIKTINTIFYYLTLFLIKTTNHKLKIAKKNNIKK